MLRKLLIQEIGLFVSQVLPRIRMFGYSNHIHNLGRFLLLFHSFGTIIFSDSDAWLCYIKRIIESYDDSQTLQTVLTTGGLGAIVGSKIAEDEGEGAFWGGIGGAILGTIISDKTKNRPVGLSIECAGCNSIFNIHIPQGLKTIRCPICNLTIEEKV